MKHTSGDPRAASRRAVLACLLVAALLGCCAGQGLPRDTKSIQGASSAFTTLSAQLKLAQSWQRLPAKLQAELRKLRAASASKCQGAASAKRADLCGSDPQLLSPLDEELMSLASFPAKFSQRNTHDTRGIVAVSRVQDQGACNTCASMAIAGAADTAFALALHRNATEVFSVQDLHFCSSMAQGQERDCYSSWRLEEALTSLAELHRRGLPAPAACMRYDPRVRDLCGTNCTQHDNRLLRLGSGWAWKQLAGAVDAQRWLLRGGAVISSMQVDPQLRAFFSRDPKGVWQGANGSDPSLSFGHAIQITGWDIPQQAWEAKNSWGPDFADNGFFRIKFGVDGVADASSLYGLRFMPWGAPASAPSGAMAPAGGSAPGCWRYTAALDDTLGFLSAALGIPARQLLLDNAALLADSAPNAPLRGKAVLLCGLSKAQRVPPQSALEALLQVKAAIDKRGTLTSWQGSGQAPGAWCSWEGIVCDKQGAIVGIRFTAQPLGGTVPDAVSLLGLPALRTLQLNAVNISGTLPASFSQLKLVDCQLNDNQLVGTLPASWGSRPLADNLGTLSIGGNALESSIPQSWGQLRNLSLLNVSSNSLTGSIPPQLGGLAQLQQFIATSNQLSGTLPTSFANLRSLQGLFLALNNLRGTLPREWSRLSNLTFLALQKNHLSGSLPPEWAALAKLHLFSARGNPLRGSCPPEWGAMSALRQLHLGQCNLTGTLPAAWGDLPMWVLNVSGNSLTRTLPAAWGGHSAMAASSSLLLDVSGNSLSGALPASWGTMRGAMVLSLAGNALSGTWPHEWRGMSALESLSLAGNQGLTGRLDLGGLQRLVVFNASNCRFSAVDWLALSRLESLQVLDLSSNGALTGSVPALPPNLLALNLAINDLHGSLAAVSKLRALQRLFVYFNRFDVTVTELPQWLTSPALKEVGIDDEAGACAAGDLSASIAAPCVPAAWLELADRMQPKKIVVAAPVPGCTAPVSGGQDGFGARPYLHSSVFRPAYCSQAQPPIGVCYTQYAPSPAATPLAREGQRPPPPSCVRWVCVGSICSGFELEVVGVELSHGD